MDQEWRHWENVARLTQHTDTVNAIAWSPDGGRLLSASQDQTARVWRLQDDDESTNWCVEGTLAGFSTALLATSWSPDGSHVVTGGSDTAVHLWDVREAEPSQYRTKWKSILNSPISATTRSRLYLPTKL